LPADDLHVEQRAALGGGELRPEVLLGVFQVDAGGAKGRGVLLHVHQGAAEVPEGGGGEGDVRAHKALGDGKVRRDLLQHADRRLHEEQGVPVRV